MGGPLKNSSTALREITLPVILTSLFLAIILAASNTYLALKVGILTAASIPAAVLSMGILRTLKGSNILQNNLVQTAASAGEAIAGGVVYTVPALIILHYWSHFPYFESVAIALLGGLLGILLSVPLRRTLVTDPQLGFPEGIAIAEVLIVGHQTDLGLRNMLLGGGVGAALELAQTGIGLISNHLALWVARGSTLLGFGFGFSPALVGAGYLIGFGTGLSLFIGAVISWGILVPILSHTFPVPHLSTADQLSALWDNYICYIGVAAMVTAGLGTLLGLLKPLFSSIHLSLKTFKSAVGLPRTERDLPLSLVLCSVAFMSLLVFLLFQHEFTFFFQGIMKSAAMLSLVCAIYVLIIGFFAVMLCAYFSGMVGVSASPGSGVMIAGLLLGALILREILALTSSTPAQILSAEAVTIFLGALITGAACIANDNIQDLKVGYLVGATPWKQQLMLMLGAITAALVIPFVMELLFKAYGIAGIFPRSGMDHSQMLAAPPAAAMAAITQAIFVHDLPWTMLILGISITILGFLARFILSRFGLKFSVLGLAIGIYLPWSSSTALFLGALFALFASFRQGPEEPNKKRGDMLLACGLVAGAALMDVALAIPLTVSHNPDILHWAPASWQLGADILGALTVPALGLWFYRLASPKNS